ncbi:OB-fold domain-containing protein [Actinomadura verrucosospora]|uniref:Protein associated with acetyl-CoA C-acyltransferase n=1 Tax=Actinomadura verrucosospora TaxID=46165 RepID=A0A7D3ZEV0_ACTVE|nr:OB-fold domain-containing protein [Actinomadura verrucosospora]QKG21377.1 protein associated with acetyl-CoA C-acyltransferase [Actinomadura verrucosospora]
MPEPHPAAPAAAIADPRPSGPPHLRGVACTACGRTAFPAQDLGCERCGADGAALRPAALAGTGTVAAAAVVHRHDGPGIDAPFTALAIVLDDGPFVHALLDGDGSPAPGTRVEAVAAGTDGDGAIVEVRFAVSGGAE